MKTIFANTIGSYEKRKNASTDQEAFSYCGGNTGNVCFADAINVQIRSDSEVSAYRLHKIENTEGKIFVLPASNWINLDGHVLRDIFLPIENKDIEIAVLGIGIQMNLHDKLSSFVNEISKNKDTIRALKIMSDHSKYIGVRGGVTQECLEKIGIKNAKVIGCPSFYEPYRIHKSIDIVNPSKDNVIINYSRGKFTYYILEQGYLDSNTVILQEMDDMSLTLWEDCAIEERHVQTRFPDMKRMSPVQMKQYLRNNGKMFYTRESWSKYLIDQKASFVWGTRFHGNMMAVSNEIPALWVMHDMRTRELIEAMKLPYITYDQLSMPFDEIISQCIYGEDFQKNYLKLAQKYVAFLNLCEIDHIFE